MITTETRGSPTTLRYFWRPLLVPMSRCSASAWAQTRVVCGRPSGMSVASVTVDRASASERTPGSSTGDRPRGIHRPPGRTEGDDLRDHLFGHEFHRPGD